MLVQNKSDLWRGARFTDTLSKSIYDLTTQTKKKTLFNLYYSASIICLILACRALHGLVAPYVSLRCLTDALQIDALRGLAVPYLRRLAAPYIVLWHFMVLLVPYSGLQHLMQAFGALCSLALPYGGGASGTLQWTD